MMPTSLFHAGGFPATGNCRSISEMIIIQTFSAAASGSATLIGISNST
jgi:hypothetical protein